MFELSRLLCVVCLFFLTNPSLSYCFSVYLPPPARPSPFITASQPPPRGDLGLHAEGFTVPSMPALPSIVRHLQAHTCKPVLLGLEALGENMARSYPSSLKSPDFLPVLVSLSSSYLVQARPSRRYHTVCKFSAQCTYCLV